MQINKAPITKEGKVELERQLDHLIKFEREKLKKTIAEARALGDLKENAEYHAAKEKQALVEGRIKQLQGVIGSCIEIDVASVKSETIVFGATVTLYCEQKDATVTYKIVGQEEADTKKGKISFASPLGKALIGKEEGDTITVKAPKGDIEYEVEGFEYI